MLVWFVLVSYLVQAPIQAPVQIPDRLASQVQEAGKPSVGAWDYSIQAVASVLVLMILCVVGYYVLARLRDSSRNDELTSKDVLGNFEEMHRGGDISEAEFRTISSVLGRKQNASPPDPSRNKTS